MSITRSHPFVRRAIPALLATTLALGLTACGGGGSSTSSTTSISGSVFAAAVDGASCEIQDANGVMLKTAITTDASGQYSVLVDNIDLENDLMLVCNGGTYTDEASGSTVTAGMMAAYVAGGTLKTNARMHATPESTIIHQLMTQHGKTLADANTAFTAAFGYTPDHAITPLDATILASGADDSQLLAGLHAAAFSQLTANLSLTTAQQFQLLTALAGDLSDGTLDGINASGPVLIEGATNLPLDIQNQFSTAMLAFHNDSKNLTGLTNDKVGILPFAKTILTSSYKVEYVPGEMAAMEGKTQFKLRLTDRTNNQPATGAAVTLMPMMHMATMMHATPVDGSCTESSTAGTYDCTVYYLMASVMNDMSMGYWDLKVMIGGMMGETANFYPPVMMAMGDTMRARLKSVGNTDQIAGMAMDGGMTMAESRDYNLFKSMLTGMTDNHSFQLFVTARETMMSFPAVITGNTLASGNNMIPNLTVTNVLVEVSTDLSTWVTAVEDGNGYWTASNLTGLTDGTMGEIYVKLSINGVQYSIDGQIADANNGYAIFSVTPGGM